MISIKSLVSILFVLVCVAVAKKDENDEMAKAIRDLQIGMSGLKEAANNPAILAQLMQDLQVSWILIRHSDADLCRFEIILIVRYYAVASCVHVPLRIACYSYTTGPRDDGGG